MYLQCYCSKIKKLQHNNISKKNGNFFGAPCMMTSHRVGNQPTKFNIPEKMAAADDSLYPIAVLIDELRNEDVQVSIVVIV